MLFALAFFPGLSLIVGILPHFRGSHSFPLRATAVFEMLGTHAQVM